MWASRRPWVGLAATVLLAAGCGSSETSSDQTLPASGSLLEALTCVQADGERSVEDLSPDAGEAAAEDPPASPEYSGSSSAEALRSLENGHELFAQRPALLLEDVSVRDGSQGSEALYFEDGDAVVYVDLEASGGGAQWWAARLVVCASGPPLP